MVAAAGLGEAVLCHTFIGAHGAGRPAEERGWADEAEVDVVVLDAVACRRVLVVVDDVLKVVKGTVVFGGADTAGTGEDLADGAGEDASTTAAAVQISACASSAGLRMM